MGGILKFMFEKLNMVSGGKRDKFANSWKPFCVVKFWNLNSELPYPNTFLTATVMISCNV
jgi:hypothetical protein